MCNRKKVAEKLRGKKSHILTPFYENVDIESDYDISESGHDSMNDFSLPHNETIKHIGG